MNLEQIDTSTTAGKAEVMRLAVQAKNRLQDYAGAWRATGCSCNNCITCDDRYMTPAEADEIAGLVEALAVHAVALERRVAYARARADLAGEKG
ncbi:hypothetical protein [Stenotrophomonas maltophilia]|uniref:hypothetical protein n=1 Tax=Stenotrophomonas maltophilia TaxID=40324 RepID=UPI001F53148C|nr:hypothetical protein [Stenotrophomonas maltophilia]MCI1124797.1 hypothetical protein [Stenotrophomonas maltophilia]